MTDKLKLRLMDGDGEPANISHLPKPLVPPTRESKHILVVGGGVVGLVTAWALLDRGFRVKIISKRWAYHGNDHSKRITSQIAGALWEFPPGGCGLTEIEIPPLSHSTLEHYRFWATESFEFYHEMLKMGGDVAKAFGLRIELLDMFFLTPLETPPHKEKYEELKNYGGVNEDVQLVDNSESSRLATRAGELGGIDLEYETGIVASYQHRAPIVDTDKALVWLMNLVRSKGADLETRTINGDLFDQERELLDDYEVDAIVNCTGLGSKETAGDNQVFPVRGAVIRKQNVDHSSFTKIKSAILLPAQKDKNDAVSRVVFLVPRNDDTLIIGSIIQRKNWELNLRRDSPEVELIWERCIKFLPMLKDAKDVEEFPLAQGLRPFSHQNARVSCEARKGSKIVHNYGHGGSGWTLAIGCVAKAVVLISKLVGVPIPVPGLTAQAGGWDEVGDEVWRGVRAPPDRAMSGVEANESTY